MTSEARRRLGVPSLAALVAANMIGAGVFTTSGFALADLGSTRWVMLAWVVGGAMAVLGALCYGALAARVSESGGEYTFLSRTLHPSIGFIAGWVSIWAGFTGAIAFAAEAAQAYVAPWVPDGIPLDILGSVAIVMAGLVHSRGVSTGARVQNVIVVIKVLLLLTLVAIGVANIPPSPAAQPAELSFGTFVVTMMWVSLSYSGWNAAVYIAGEARDPKRTLPRSMLFGALAVTALYLALNWVFIHAAPMDQLAGREDVAAIAARALGGAGLESFVRAILLVALLTSISSMVMIGPRVIAQMAGDKLLPRQLAFSGDVPRTAIWTQVLLSVGMLWASGLREQLTNLGWILSLFTALAVLGLLRLRRREGAQLVPIPGYPFVPYTFLALVVVLTGTMLFVNGRQLIPALVVLVSGALIYALRHRSPST
ncbi:MAG: amino acid transporter [Chlamydiales bacterium]|jgi:amino acid transporter